MYCGKTDLFVGATSGRPQDDEHDKQLNPQIGVKRYYKRASNAHPYGSDVLTKVYEYGNNDLRRESAQGI